MTHEEKRAWIYLAVTVVAFATYVVLLLRRADGRPLADTPYAGLMLATIGAAILASILAEVALAMVQPRASRSSDVRDRDIRWFGDRVGQAFVILGAVAALLMAMAEWQWFWIANVLYLGFVLSAVVGTSARVIAYRGGLPQW